MAHPLELIAQREAELDALSRARGLSSAELAEVERLKVRKNRVIQRLPQQIASAERKIIRLRTIFDRAQVAA